MTIRKTVFIITLIALAGLAFSLWASPRLPETVPSHWNAAGEVDGYSSRGQALFFLPVLTFGLGLLLIYLPNIDPLRANVERFRGVYHWAIIGFSVFFIYLHVLTLLAGMGININMTYSLIPAMGLLFFGLGFMVERAQPNWFIGIRTPWTLSSPTVWQKTHRVGGLAFKVSGVLALVGLIFPVEVGFWFTLIPPLITALGTIIYSYVAYQQERGK
jgi:uncharacterized membrane protein